MTETAELSPSDLLQRLSDAYVTLLPETAQTGARILRVSEMDEMRMTLLHAYGAIAAAYGPAASPSMLGLLTRLIPEPG